MFLKKQNLSEETNVKSKNNITLCNVYIKYYVYVIHLYCMYVNVKM